MIPVGKSLKYAEKMTKCNERQQQSLTLNGDVQFVLQVECFSSSSSPTAFCFNCLHRGLYGSPSTPKGLLKISTGYLCLFSNERFCLNSGLHFCTLSRGSESSSELYSYRKAWLVLHTLHCCWYVRLWSAAISLHTKMSRQHRHRQR